MISFNWTISGELALSCVASLRSGGVRWGRGGGEPHHQVPAQDLGSLDQNIWLIRAPLFRVSHRFDDVSHCWKSSWIHMLASANTLVVFLILWFKVL